MTAVFFLIASILIRIVWQWKKPDCHWLYPVLTLALPFAAGGFHTGTAAALSLVIGWALLEQIPTTHAISFCCSQSSISVLLLLAAYCLTPLWAADRGMAVFAFPRYLPLGLYMLFLMQRPRKEQQQALDLISLCGCMMTVLSLAVLLIPGLRGYVTVNGRLAGFFQYPNAFAAFLLTGLILLNNRSIVRKTDIPANILLVTGIVLSGSKTVFALMCAVLLVLCLMKREGKTLLLLGAAMVLGLGAGLLADSLGLLHQADRFSDIHADSGTFLVRLLYFRDVLPAILSHPFGLGYMSYPAIEGTIQTGRYYVTYIHNGLLQLLLEIGWLPALLMAASLLRAIFSRQTPTAHRLVLIAVSAHCMLDFDLQFSVFWIILLSCLDLQSGKKISFSCPRIGFALTACLLSVSLWLGCGDWLHRMGWTDACLTLTPFHTEALAARLSDTSDPRQLDQTANEILNLNPTHSLAHSAKANAAFSAGDIRSMILSKQKAIHCAPYTTEEYCDYFEKLYVAMQMYLQAGDRESAEYCWKELQNIPKMMEDVSQNTHPLAYLTGDDPTLILPPDYSEILQQSPF